MKTKKNGMFLQRHSEAEPKNPRKVQHNDWILHFASAPFRMTIPALAFIFTLIATAASWAACDNGYPYGYMKDGKCVNCPNMPGYCHWDPDQEKVIMDGCAGDLGYTFKNGRCVPACSDKYGSCSECSYNNGDRTDPIACIKCYSGYELKNERCVIACGHKYTGCEECYYDNDENPTGCKRYACRYKYSACSECSYNEDGSGPIACIKCGYGYEAKNGRCIEACGHKYNACSECSYDEDGSPIACIKCGSGFKAKNGTCTWGAPGTSCGDGYVDGDGVCYKIPDGCESASATDGSCIKCSDGLSLDDDNNCIQCNKEGYKDVGGYCNRVRYTPAEAAAVMNGNDNTITITFKK